MNSPQKELGEYLEILIRNLRFAKAYQTQLNIINDWKFSNKFSAINTGSFFFLLVLNSFNNTILLELYKITAKRENKNIIDWLTKAKSNSSALILKQLKPYNGYEVIKASAFNSIVDKHLEKLTKVNKTIENLQNRRDKFVAHTDNKYFADSEKLFKDFPISSEDISSLIEIIDSILHKHYSFFFQTDIDINIYSTSNVDSILRNVYAFNKIWQDSELVEKGFRPIDYLPKEKEILY
ncbi:MAG: hypothetical protein H8D22_08450 [Candidatus Cloacimonetes bacterium]|nr:hypothetical protein [Candidatus Cloacimonadota bacterium]